jgi:sugar O-acyltransferase (sialic acid O-acetyltransferase NeuD family)
MKKLLIVGAGGHGRSVAELVQLKNEFELVGFIDDSWPQHKSVWSYSIHGRVSELSQYHSIADWVIVAIGNNKLRGELINKFVETEFNLATVIHPMAMVSPSADIGAGTAIMAGAIIGTESKLGLGVIINSGANVDHHCVIADFGHLGVNACMAGGSSLGEAAWLQAGGALGYGVVVPAGKIIPPCVGVN